MLVEFDIYTGRRHQIRVHASEGLASPVLGDERYGSDNGSISAAAAKGDSSQRFFLHASKLAIPRFDVEVEAPIPSWWRESIPELE